jgi:PUA-domain protein
MRKQLNKSEIKELNSKVLELYGKENFLSKKDKVEKENNLVFVNQKLYFFFQDDVLIPTLRLMLDEKIGGCLLKKITVDMGAIKFVTSGADVMRPGITKIDEGISVGEFVVIIDETHGKALAIGKVLFNSEEMLGMNSGKVIENIHYVGDEMWNIA